MDQILSEAKGEVSQDQILTRKCESSREKEGTCHMVTLADRLICVHKLQTFLEPPCTANVLTEVNLCQ